MKVICKYCGNPCDKERNVVEDTGRFCCSKCRAEKSNNRKNKFDEKKRKLLPPKKCIRCKKKLPKRRRKYCNQDCVRKYLKIINYHRNLERKKRIKRLKIK